MTPRATGSDGTPRKKKPAADAPAPKKAAARRPSAAKASKPAAKDKDRDEARPTKAAARAPAKKEPAPRAAAKAEAPAKPAPARSAAKKADAPAPRAAAAKEAPKPPPPAEAPAPDARPAAPRRRSAARAAAPADAPAAPAPREPASPAPAREARPAAASDAVAPAFPAKAAERPPAGPPRVEAPPAPRPPPLPLDEDGWVPMTGEAVEPARGPVPSLPTDEEGWEPIADVPSASTPSAHPPRPSIPPLPDDDQFAPDDGDDDDDDFEPLDDDGPPRTAPPGATARQVYDAVRRGDLHVAALDGFGDDVLAALATEVGLEARPGERRPDLLYRLLEHQPAAPEPPTYETEGVLELVPEGFGFLRTAAHGYYVGPFDPYVPVGVVRKLGLTVGHFVSGTARAPRPGERYPTLVHVESVNHEEPEVLAKVVPFDRLTVTHPDRRYVLETAPEETAMRVVDLFCPLGRGQRALIVSPPRAGKTILLQKIADSVARNYPEVEIVVLLVDERPEEVTNMRRSVRGEVIASTFDQPPHRHIRVAELAIEKVKRMVELGRHVVLLIDSLTRLGRAYNNETGGGGRLLTGGLEATALTKPKRFFGAARNIEHGGSLTIVASALVDTGSRLDQVIFEEFKGTGNMEIVLSRDIANQRVWPAIDVAKSGTRREDLLLHPEEQRRIVALRRDLLEQDPAEAMVEIVTKMAKHKTNAELLMRTAVD
ncbi:MAG: transcription termination factor Rho [Planctomycetota bacterium]